MKEETFEKYKLVVDEWFVNGFNGTKAYQKFYPKASDEVGANMFSEIVRIHEVFEYKKQKENKAQIALQTSHGRVLEELRNWAYSDITETLMLTPNEVKELPKNIRRLITKFKHSKKISSSKVEKDQKS